MKRAGALLLTALLWACTPSCRPVPPVETVTEDDDVAVVVVPEPDPPPPVSGTACERACARYEQLACKPVMEGCVEACEAYEAQGLAYSWMPECADEAITCEAWNACATGPR